MKHIIYSVLGTFLGGILLILFQQPITDALLTDKNIPKAEILVGPWYPYPGSDRSDEDTPRVLEKVLEEPASVENYAMIRVQNRGRVVQENVRVRLDYPFSGVVTRGSEKKKEFEWEKEVTLDPLKPGDTVAIHIWSLLDLNGYRTFETYSSEGSFPIRFRSYEDGPFRDQHPFFRVLSYWIMPFLGFVVVISGFGYAAYSDWLRKFIMMVMEDEDYYLEERQNYETNNHQLDIDHDNYNDKLSKFEKVWRRRNNAPPPVSSSQ